MPHNHRDNTAKAVLHQRTGRFFATINGKAYYRSTGNNSAMKGTWFPFFGVAHKSNPFRLRKFKRHDKGWLVKAYKYAKRVGLHDELGHYRNAELNRLFTNKYNKRGKLKTTKNFYHRMTFLESVIISARLGGGIWNTAFGISLRDKLTKEKPEIDLSSIAVIESGSIKQHQHIDKEYSEINQLVKSGLS